MQKHLQTQDSNTEVVDAGDVRTIHKPYVSKKLPKKQKGQRVYVSLTTFKKDLYIFDPEMRKKYTNAQVIVIMKLILKKAAERIVKKLWRMPFPNGVGLLYMKEAQVSHDATSKGKIDLTDRETEALLRKIRMGLRRVFMKWNKERVRFAYQDIWSVKRSHGFFRSCLHAEVKGRAMDRTKANYRGHIM